MALLYLESSRFIFEVISIKRMKRKVGITIYPRPEIAEKQAEVKKIKQHQAMKIEQDLTDPDLQSIHTLDLSQTIRQQYDQKINALEDKIKVIEKTREKQQKQLDQLTAQSDQQQKTIERLNKENTGLQNRIHRTDIYLNQLKVKVFSFETTINHLKKSLREKEIQNKNLQSHYRNIKQYDTKANSNNRVEDPKDRDFNKVMADMQYMQYDLEILLDNIMKKQEEYRNKADVLENERKRQESTTVFNASLCTKIEAYMNQFVNYDNIFFKMFTEIKNQNLRLQQEIQQLTKFRQSSIKTEQKIEEYVSMLEGIINQYSEEIGKAKDLRNSLQNHPRIEKGENQLLKARIAQLQFQLRSANDKCRLLTQYELDRNKLEAVNKLLENQLQQLKEKNKTHTELANKAISEQQRYSNQLFKAQEKVEQLEKSIETMRKKLSMASNSSILASSSILLEVKTAKDIIISQIEKFQKKNIRKTEIVFRKDKFHHNFGNYLSQSFPLLLLIQVNENTLFGAYSSFYIPEGKSKDSFIFTFDKDNKLRTYFKNEGKDTSKSITYSQNALTFGYNEVFIRNNSQIYELTLITNNFGGRYYDFPSKLPELQGMVNNNKMNFLNMEIHKIRY